MRLLKVLVPTVLVILGVVAACGQWNSNECTGNDCTDNQRTDPGPPGIQGPGGDPGEPGKDGQPCTLSDDGVLTCGTKSFKLPKGEKGDAGAPGANGESVVFQMVDASLAQCATGGSVLLLAYDTDFDGVLTLADEGIRSAITCNGATGATGSKGDKGDAGDKGDKGDTGDKGIAGDKGDKGDKGDTGSTGDKGDKGDKGDQGIAGDTGSKGDKGDKGDTGSQAPASQFQITKTIAACGVNSSAWKEVLLCLADGTLIASFSNNVNGDYTRLAIIPPGNYMNTDNSGCNFSVTASGSTSIVSWAAGANWAAGAVVCGQ